MKRDAFLQIRRLYDSNSDGGAGAAATSGQGEPGKDGSGGSGTPATWDAFFGGLDDARKKLIDEHVAGLKASLANERKVTTDLQKQVKEWQGKAEKGSEMETQLADMSSKLEESQRRASFAEWASKNNVTDTTLAYLAAKEANVFDNSGSINGERLRELHPNLFKSEEKPKAGGRGDAGSAGTGGGTAATFDGNAFLAGKAGLTTESNSE